MKETGIVRKLDNLGRLVIPKEIRRCMRIKEGSPIEFALLPSGEIVLCKYSLVEQVTDYAEDFCQVLGDILDCGVMITDRDRILASHGMSKKSTIGAKLSVDVLDIIDTQNSYSASKKDNTTIIPIIEGDSNTYQTQLIYPITIQGDVEGEIILVDTKDDRVFGLEHITTLKMVASFISLQMQ